MDAQLSLSAAVTAVALVVTVLVFRCMLLSTRQPTNLTATNTLLNANSTSDLSRRRISNRLALWQEDDDSEVVNDSSSTWTFKSKPIPESVRSCLKRQQLITPATNYDDVDDSPQSTPASGGSVTPSTAGAPATVESMSTSARRRQVRVIEPDKGGLEELRAFWRNVGGPQAYGGIGGYRPTSLFAKSKSGGGGPAAASAKPMVRVGVPLTPGESDEEMSEPDKAESDSSDETTLPTATDTPTPIGRPSVPRLAVPVPARNSSLSPTRASRARNGSPSGSSPTSGVRTGSPAFVASRPGTRRRALSSSPAPAERAPSQASAPEAAQPKWVKNKKGKGAATSLETVTVAPVDGAKSDDDPAQPAAKAKGKAAVQFADSEESSSEFEDMSSTDVSRQTSPERERPKVTVTAPALAATTPPQTTAKVTQSTTPTAPAMPNGNRSPSGSPTLPVRTSSMHMNEAKPTRTIGGRNVSFEENSQAPLVA